MQSVLIVGQIEKTREAAQNLCRENKIGKFDVQTFETEKAVGIGDIRNLQKKLFLKPLESETKALILEAFFGMTVDSQNAFLKVLEEPPAHTIIIILVSSLDFVLPTILSRCNLINLDKVRKLSDEEIKNNLTIISDLKKGGMAEALLAAQNNSKDRETALRFLENLLIGVHEALENKEDEFSTQDLQKILKGLQKTHTTIKTTNVAPRFALENLFLNLF
jgi:DNA polymerase III delta prime subunit